MPLFIISSLILVSVESALILIRHGESLWNEKNLFTGCVDEPLTKKGIEEALQAGIRICNIPIDVIYTSTLIRAQMTAMLAMTQHRHKKVPGSFSNYALRCFGLIDFDKLEIICLDEKLTLQLACCLGIEKY